MLPKQLIHPRLERRFSPATEQHITGAQRLHIYSRRLIIGALILWLAGCNNQQPAAQGPPPAEVTVSKPEQKEVVNWNEFTGRTAALKLVKVTPRVSGYIVDIPFKEGDLVHKGDLLFQIDPRPYQDAADQAAAQVVSAQAALKAAQLNLEFTHVTSPIDGRVSRQLVNIGNLVQADSTQLTTIVSIDPIYAYFSMDELAALIYQRLVREGKLASSQDGKVH